MTAASKAIVLPPYLYNRHMFFVYLTKKEKYFSDRRCVFRIDDCDGFHYTPVFR